MKNTEKVALLGYKKGKKVSEYRVFINGVNLARFLERKNGPIYVHTRNGKLYIGKNFVRGSAERRFLVHHAYGQPTNTEIYLPPEIAVRIEKFNERNGRSKKYVINKWWDIRVVLKGFPKSATRKYSRLESVIKAQKASVPVLERKYGKSWASKIGRLGEIKRKKLRSLFENDMVRATLEAGIPAAIYEPDIEEVNGVPDLLLPNRIIIEFAGYSQADYIQRIIEKVNALKDSYKIIVVAYNCRAFNALKHVLHDVCVIPKNKYVKWIEIYAQWLKTTLQKELPPIPLPT